MFDEDYDLDNPPDIFDEGTKDGDIVSFKEQLDSLKKSDFPVLGDIEKIKCLINTDEETNCLKIFKLLYCLGFTKYSFLYAGIILESKLNNVANLYIDKNWQLGECETEKRNHILKNQFIEKKSSPCSNNNAKRNY